MNRIMKKYIFCCVSPTMSRLDVLLPLNSSEPFESTELILPEEAENEVELPDQTEEKINYVIVISTQTIILLFVLFFAYISQKETIGPGKYR